jgi:hypothetical protein
LKYQGKNELLKHMESPWISILINLVRIKPKKTDGIRKHQHHSNYKANQTPSSLSWGANTFPLRNQSLALESLKDQFRFPSDHNTKWRLPFTKK